MFLSEDTTNSKLTENLLQQTTFNSSELSEFPAPHIFHRTTKREENFS